MSSYRLSRRITVCRPALAPLQMQARRRSRGFSMIELMVTVAIVAILLSVALPNLTDTLNRNRIAAAANEFLAGLNYARSEALRRNGNAGVCASTSGVACDGAWSDHWIVFLGSPAAPDVLRQGEFSGKDAFTAKQGSTVIAFNARGMLETDPDLFELRPASCAAGKPMRRLFDLRRTGYVAVLKGDCT